MAGRRVEYGGDGFEFYFCLYWLEVEVCDLVVRLKFNFCLIFCGGVHIARHP